MTTRKKFAQQLRDLGISVPEDRPTRAQQARREDGRIMWRATEYTYRTRVTFYPDAGEDGPYQALDHMLKETVGPVRRLADALVDADAPDAPEQRGDGITVSMPHYDWDVIESWLHNHDDFVRVR